MELKWPGKSGTRADVKGGTLVNVEGRNAMVIEEAATAGFNPNRKVVDVTNGEIVEVCRNANATVYNTAKIVLE